MLIDFRNGQTGIILRVKLRDSSQTDGRGITGLTSASAGLRIATIADNEAAPTAYTVAGSTIETITTLGTYATPTATKCRFKEVDATNHKGIYEIHLDNTRYAVNSAKHLIVSISGATNQAECDVLIPLRTVDPYVNGGKSPVTVAAADVSGNVPAAVQSIANNAITAAAIANNALNGKGDWNTVAPDNAGIATANAGIAAIAGYVDTEVAAIKAVTDVLAGMIQNSAGNRFTAKALEQAPTGGGGSAPTVEEIVAGVLAGGNIDGLTLEQSHRVFLTVLGGLIEGAATGTIVFKNRTGSKTRVTATVDANGNRSAVTYDTTA